MCDMTVNWPPSSWNPAFTPAYRLTHYKLSNIFFFFAQIIYVLITLFCCSCNLMSLEESNSAQLKLRT